jgi:hypothetical protein
MESIEMHSNSKGLRKKVKLFLLTICGSPQGCETSRLPHFLDTRLKDGSEVDSLTHRPPFTPQEDTWYSFLLEAESTLGLQWGWKGYGN